MHVTTKPHMYFNSVILSIVCCMHASTLYRELTVQWHTSHNKHRNTVHSAVHTLQQRSSTITSSNSNSVANSKPHIHFSSSSSSSSHSSDKQQRKVQEDAVELSKTEQTTPPSNLVCAVVQYRCDTEHAFRTLFATTNNHHDSSSTDTASTTAATAWWLDSSNRRPGTSAASG
jgi:hypothetical protein